MVFLNINTIKIKVLNIKPNIIKCFLLVTNLYFFCNSFVSLNNTIEKKCMYFIVLKNSNYLILLNIFKKQSKKIHNSEMLTRSHYFAVV